MKITKKKNKTGKITSKPVVDPFPTNVKGFYPESIYGKEIKEGIDALMVEDELKEKIKRGELTGNGQ